MTPSIRGCVEHKVSAARAARADVTTGSVYLWTARGPAPNNWPGRGSGQPTSNVGTRLCRLAWNGSELRRRRLPGTGPN